MKKMKLLAMMAVLAAVICIVVIYGSPYAALVQPVMEIEEIWAIEDAREESDEPLVTMLENRGVPLAYDAQSNTFYCTLGLENGDEWPDVHLHALDAGGVKLAFVDDYTYDWCADAIRDGYPYQVMAYTDEEFWYFDLVFTGLPIVMIDAKEELRAHEDVPAELAVSWDGKTALRSHVRTHKRGDTTLRMSEKYGIKVEFTRNANGTQKISQEVPGLGMTDEFILIGFAFEPQLLRDRLSWEVWNRITREDEPFGPRQTQYAEVFVNGEYQGVYLMMKPYNYVQELGKDSAAAAQTDSVYRTAGDHVYEFDRPLAQDYRHAYYEAHHGPLGRPEFEALQPYLEMIAQEDDEVFCEMALELLDMDSVIRYCLFIEAGCMMDNEKNNLYIWAHRENGRPKYRFATWDMDNSWGRQGGIENTDVWIGFPLFDRLLRLDCGGFFCKRTFEIWQEMRALALNDAFISEVLDEYVHQLGDSGAYAREADRWGRDEIEPDASNVYTFAMEHFQSLDRVFEELTDPQLRRNYYGAE